MRKYRRHAIIVLAVLAALVTPPDVASMVLVMIPLYGLYEFSIRVVARVEKRTKP
jgi:sec-independent protein translocase protein TatC